jgi:pimeloyl-ACP methyl ester carboxylesterase
MTYQHIQITKPDIADSAPIWDCRKTPQARPSEKKYRSLLSVNEDLFSRMKRRMGCFATVPIWLVLPGSMGKAETLAEHINFPSPINAIFIDYIAHNGLSYAGVCTDVQALVLSLQKQYNTQHIHAVGYSLGGRVLTSLQSQYPQLLHHLALISSGLPLTSPKQRYLKRLFDLEAIHKCRALSARDFLTWWYGLALFRPLPEHPTFQDFLTQRVRGFNAQHTALIMDRLSALHMPLQRLQAIDQLTYIYGACDTKYAAVATRIQADIPHAQLIEIPEASHMCWFNAPVSLKRSTAFIQT